MSASVVESAAGETPVLAPRPAAKPLPAKPSTAKIWLRAIERTSRIEANPQRLFADLIEDWASRQPDRPSLLSDRESFSYRDLNERINRYARWARATGISKGDTVCLLVSGQPDYLAAWLGLSKIGIIVALINTKLVGTSLAHCIEVADGGHIIVGQDLAAAFEAVRSGLKRAPKVWWHGVDAGEASINAALNALDASPLSAGERGDVSINDRALLIYTSGTTGLPKAASISHRRILNWGGWFAGLTNAAPEDRLFDCLPLFHSVGGVVAPCSMLTAGASVVLTDKFSGSTFWHDVVRWDCTLFQYIGELCRYLLKAPASEFETQHRLRLACGNGLRGDIWDAFQARFAIPQILEFYAATEGNFSLYNVEGKPGAIGRIPPLLAHRFPAAIVRMDADTGLPVRNADGLCQACGTGEPGEAVGRIGTADEAGGRFEGYTNAAETEKKVLRDVFAKGDAWCRTGDLMKIDESGFFHFIDRLGDTFRWKGENVATFEVNEAILDCPGVVEATTYGVSVPGTDGRAGMAAIVADNSLDFGDLSDHLTRRLPAYACPVFIRCVASLDSTETFKQKKQDLARAGFDPCDVRDPLFYRDPKSGRFLPLDAGVHAQIVQGAIRL
jgi:fatty-acyl-CoA synthase